MLEHVTVGLVLTLLVDAVLRLGLAIRIVTRRASVSTSLAWLAIVLFAPLAGAVLYLMVGEVRLGRRRARRHEAVARRLVAQFAAIRREQAEAPPDEMPEHAPVSRLAMEATGIPPLAGNRLDLLVEDRFLETLVADIDAAESHVHVLTYIWHDGGAGDRIGEALLRAREREVPCRVLVDGVGSRPFLRGAMVQRLRAAGVEVVVALPANPLRAVFARLDLRNHRKLAVIDGRVAHVGSHNLTDDRFRVARRPNIGPWLDATVRLEGPAVHAAQLTFLQDWAMDASPRQREAVEQLIPGDLPDDPDGAVVQVMPSGPSGSPGSIRDALLATIWSARRELVMTTPYFVPDDAMRAALRSAAQRGVRVTIVVPAQVDAPLVALAGRAQFDELLDAGVRIMRHQRGLLHAKSVVADRSFAIIGSVNLDVRSFFLNFELSLFVLDSDFASLVAWMQERYIEESIEIELGAWRARPRVLQLVESAARLFSPVL